MCVCVCVCVLHFCTFLLVYLLRKESNHTVPMVISRKQRARSLSPLSLSLHHSAEVLQMHSEQYTHAERITSSKVQEKNNKCSLTSVAPEEVTRRDWWKNKFLQTQSSQQLYELNDQMCLFSSYSASPEFRPKHTVHISRLRSRPVVRTGKPVSLIL